MAERDPSSRKGTSTAEIATAAGLTVDDLNARFVLDPSKIDRDKRELVPAALVAQTLVAVTIRQNEAFRLLANGETKEAVQSMDKALASVEQMISLMKTMLYEREPEAKGG